MLSDGTEPEALQAAGAGGGAASAAGVLSGTPASAGTVTARARVILDPQGAHLEPGEILVAPSTDPGWTPLFLTAGGLVMEMGGPTPTAPSSPGNTAFRRWWGCRTPPPGSPPERASRSTAPPAP